MNLIRGRKYRGVWQCKWCDFWDVEFLGEAGYGNGCYLLCLKCYKYSQGVVTDEIRDRSETHFRKKLERENGA